MKDTLLFIVQKLVDHPDDLAVTQSGEGDRITLKIKTHPDDMGKIIGKNGRIIKAIRDLLKILATRKHVYLDVALEE